MSLLHVKIAGYELDDKVVLKTIIGIICIILLFIMVGQTVFSDWVVKSLVIWVGVTLIVVPLTFVFIEEQLDWIHLIMIIVGVTVLIFFGIMGNMPQNLFIITVLESLVWMTIFSIILDTLKDGIKKSIRR